MSNQNALEPGLRLKRPQLLDYLWEVQNKQGYIREEDLVVCSQALGISTIEVEGVISFYHFLCRKPRGQLTIYLNNSIMSECKGFERVKEAFESATGCTFNQVDPSGRWGLFETACIGLSDLEPAALINFHPFTNLHSLKVKDLVLFGSYSGTEVKSEGKTYLILDESEILAIVDDKPWPKAGAAKSKKAKKK